jgi:solute carrier family 39 (zinc transporter), member 9
VEFTPLATALLLFTASLVGALLPLYRRWSERGLHLLVSVSAGIFLGTIFLHLLPTLAGMGEGENEAREIAASSARTMAPAIAPWIAALAGLLLLFVLEKVWLRSLMHTHGTDPHTALWAATFVGLSLHSITSGVALTAILEHPSARTQFLISLLIHKATETFSLATVMRLANLPRWRSLLLLVIFAAIEPSGLLFGRAILSSDHALDAVLTGFACGTFLYVSICDLLPEVFHGSDRPALKVAAVAAGIGLTALTL